MLGHQSIGGGWAVGPDCYTALTGEGCVLGGAPKDLVLMLITTAVLLWP